MGFLLFSLIEQVAVVIISVPYKLVVYRVASMLGGG